MGFLDTLAGARGSLLSSINGLKIEYNENKDEYTANISIRRLIKYLNAKKIMDIKKTTALFSSVDLFSFKFKSFFLQEVIDVFNYCIGLNRSLPVNMNILKEFIIYFDDKEREFLNNVQKKIDIDRLNKILNFKVLEHQKPVLDKYNIIKNRYHYRGLLINASVGSGKTAMSVFISESLNLDVIVVIAPLRIMEATWKPSIQYEMYIKPPSVYVVGENKDKYKNEKYVLCSYERLDKLLELAGLLMYKRISIVVDESHNFAEANSVRTKNLLKFADITKSNNVILLSGTPVKAYRTELVTIFKLLDKRFDDKVEKIFKILYTSPSRIHIDTLPKRFGDYSVKVEKKELSLPDLITENLPVDLPNKKEYTLDNIKIVLADFIRKRTKEINEAMPMYTTFYNNTYNKYKNILINSGKVKIEEFIKYENNIVIIQRAYRNKALFTIPDIMKEARSFEQNVLMPMMDKDEKRKFKEACILIKYPMLKIQGEALSGVIMRYRINCHRDMAAAINYKDIVNSTLKKTIIFSNYIEVCEACNNKTKKDGYNSLCVYGAYLPQANSNISKFKTVSKFNPLIATYKSLSTGVRLTEANVIITLDLPFRLYLYEQAVGRAHRLGQDNNVTVFIPTLHFDTPTPNINSRNIDIISFFKEEVENITGIKADIDIDLSNEGIIDLNTIHFVDIVRRDFMISTGSESVFLNW